MYYRLLLSLHSIIAASVHPSLLDSWLNQWALFLTYPRGLQIKVDFPSLTDVLLFLDWKGELLNLKIFYLLICYSIWLNSIAEITKNPKSTSFIFQAISMAVQRANVQCVQGAYGESAFEELDEIFYILQPNCIF